MEACSKFWNQIISCWIHFSESVLLGVIAVNLQDVVLSKFQQQRVVLVFVDTEKQMNYWQCVLTYIEIHFVYLPYAYAPSLVLVFAQPDCCSKLKVDGQLIHTFLNIRD